MPKKCTKKHHRGASVAAERSKVPEQPRVPSLEIVPTRNAQKSAYKTSEPPTPPRAARPSTQATDNNSALLCPSCARDPTAPDPAIDRQFRTDRIESLKLSTKDFETENTRLKGIVEEKKKDLAEKTNQLRKMVGKNEFKKRMREVGKQKKNKGGITGGGD